MGHKVAGEDPRPLRDKLAVSALRNLVAFWINNFQGVIGTVWLAHAVTDKIDAVA